MPDIGAPVLPRSCETVILTCLLGRTGAGIGTRPTSALNATVQRLALIGRLRLPPFLDSPNELAPQPIRCLRRGVVALLLWELSGATFRPTITGGR